MLVHKDNLLNYLNLTKEEVQELKQSPELTEI